MIKLQEVRRKFWVFKFADGSFYKLSTRGSWSTSMNPITYDEVSTDSLRDAFQFETETMPNQVPIFLYESANGKWIQIHERSAFYTKEA